MLKMRSEVKESLLLAFFAFLLSEYLTVVTIAFVALGTILVIFKFRPGKLARNIIALGVFGSYWWSYGKVIDPEVGLNFLVTVIVLKLMEKETLRDRFMIFFGLLLVISAGSLFEKTLSYVIFFGISFSILIQDFYQNIGARWRIGELLKALLWVLPLTGFLFFLSPRAMSPLPFQQGTPTQGEVGYTSNLNISDIDSLSGNDNPVFTVQVSKKIPHDQLYWRGNSISFSDGWNWIVMNREYPHVLAEENLIDSNVGIHQSFRVKNREDYFFTLDQPSKLFAKGRTFDMQNSNSFPQARNDWSPRYDVTSFPKESYPADLQKIDHYKRTPLKNADKRWIEATFLSKTAPELINEVHAYFTKNGFTYSISPGKTATFRDFMNKKVGFCSHYASALGIILRTKKIPARLVSGFMGGTYNQYADYYEITQNDAHVWVEVFHEGNWVRVDPTGWIAPGRLELGGEAFMISNSGLRMNFLNRFGWYYEMNQWFSQWDFVFYQWLENMDYQQQESWLKKFKISRQWLYSIAILVIALFMGLYAWTLQRQTRNRKFSFHQELWHLFLEKLHSRGLTLNPVSLSESRESLEKLKHKDRDQLLQIWDKLVALSFAKKQTGPEKELFLEIKRL